MKTLVLTIGIIGLLTVPAVAADPVVPSRGGSITTWHPLPGVTWQSDGHGTTTTIIESVPGISTYTQRDRNGTITQGTIWEPIRERPTVYLPIPNMDPLPSERGFYNPNAK